MHTVGNQPIGEDMPNDYENPFDRPLDSEVSEHQQQHATTTAASPIGNPFDEPLLSEKLEAQAAQAAQSGLPSPEESDFLSKNPGYKHFPTDPKFPNRPAGIYPVGPG